MHCDPNEYRPFLLFKGHAYLIVMQASARSSSQPLSSLTAQMSVTWYNATTIIVDDADPSIVFLPDKAWPKVKVAAEYNAYENTLTVGEEPGFTVHFTFEGSHHLSRL